jgi:hypothetical protein
VAADTHAGTLGAVHHDRCVPAHEATELALEVHVAGVPRLLLGRDGVDVVGRGQRRQPQVLVTSAFEEPQHDVAGPVATVPVDHSVKGFEPFGCLVRVDVGQVGR